MENGKMNRNRRYAIIKPVLQMSGIFGIDPRRVMQRAGLAPELLQQPDLLLGAQEYFDLSSAALVEAGGSERILDFAAQLAGSPFIPAVLAFSSSPNTEIGLKRLSLFKPLVGPCALEVWSDEDQLHMSVSSGIDEVRMPEHMAIFELVYFLECTRRFTCSEVKPVSVGLTAKTLNLEPFEEYFGCPITPSDRATLAISREDARRPLLSQNDEFWAWLEVDLHRQLDELDSPSALQDRVRQTLIDIMPSGDVSSETVCRRLALSKRSLQRGLQQEGTTFLGVLEKTREELSLRYLQKGQLSTEEISYLLAYKDPSSFYRAFNAWTGMTPSDARGTRH